jgi:hypothetical protein
MPRRFRPRKTSAQDSVDSRWPSEIETSSFCPVAPHTHPCSAAGPDQIIGVRPQGELDTGDHQEKEHRQAHNELGQAGGADQAPSDGKDRGNQLTSRICPSHPLT